MHLAATSRTTIDDLRHHATADRIELAKHFLEAANRFVRARPAQPRSAISRYYYSMYHAIRGVVFFSFKGDDHESHTKLPGNLPKDFPDRSYWSNEVKNARENRNAADYEPYPAPHATWRSMASDLQGLAPILLSTSIDYLRAKGCNYL
ncbi:HEPN domain-containing protein [Pseudonocardia oceani]|uniref:HEPN domain-containing protein n=1 Tax=Pseudonocardia oceani TaxID=2792013 RepID=A0ABS6U9Z1_9PSEU|nr:HEPN domain-containing protein [Pseudonocardia oceani]MBW0129045.1 HEPN domain-containing protein [Pseudonocardia oceani]